MLSVLGTGAGGDEHAHADQSAGQHQRASEGS
jgi:hypothetical protein